MLKYLLVGLLFLSPLCVSAQSSETVFEVDILNAGLGNTPDEVDRLTPQTAVWSFISAIDDEDYERAAHLLNLNGIDVSAQSSVGAQLAEKLGVIMDRKLVVSWQALLERPDALDANASTKDPLAGQARRSLLLGVLELDSRPVAIRLNRVQPKDGTAVWVFSRQSVDVIDPLFNRFGPSKLEKSLPDWARQKGPFGLFWWEIIGVPLTLLLAGFLATFSWQLLNTLSRKASGTFMQNLLSYIRLPVVLVVIATTVLIATSYIFVVSGLISNILEPVLVLLFVSAAMILIVNVIDAFLEHSMVEDVEELASPDEEDRRARATTIFAVRRMIVAIAVLAGTGITLATANVFATLGFSLLASAGGLTLLLGFAAREVLGNILASLQISANRSARVGDQLIFEDTLCTVERIHFSFVKLKVWDGTRLIVPVSEFVSQSFINRTLTDSDMIRKVLLTVSPHVDVEKLRGFYEDWMDGDDRVSGSETYECLVTDQGEFGMTIRFCAHVPDPRDGWFVECELREALLRYLSDNEADALPHLGTENATQNDGDADAGDGDV